MIYKDSDNSDSEYENNEMDSDDEGRREIYPYDIQKKIVHFWLNDLKSGKKVPFKRMKHLWNRLPDVKILTKWKKKIDAGKLNFMN